MNIIKRAAKALKSWGQQKEPLPQHPPVPGRPGGQVGNSRPTRSDQEVLYPSQGGGLG